jgi:hypothetical protein
VAYTSATPFPVIADPSVHLHWTTFTVELYPVDQNALMNGGAPLAAAGVGALICSETGPGAAMCAGGVYGAVSFIMTYVRHYYHPHCHLNLSFYYGGRFDRWWTSQCS